MPRPRYNINLYFYTYIHVVIIILVNLYTFTHIIKDLCQRAPEVRRRTGRVPPDAQPRRDHGAAQARAAGRPDKVQVRSGGAQDVYSRFL